MLSHGNVREYVEIDGYTPKNRDVIRMSASEKEREGSGVEWKSTAERIHVRLHENRDGGIDNYIYLFRCCE